MRESPSPADQHAAHPPRPVARDRRVTPPPPVAPMRRIFTQGAWRVEYLLRVSARARRLRLVIKPGSGLEVVTPRGVPIARVEEVLREKATWIQRTLTRMAQVEAQQQQSAPPSLATGAELPFAGRTLRLTIATGAPPGRFKVALSQSLWGETLLLTLPNDRANDQTTMRAALERWYRQQANAIFAERLEHCNAHFGFTYQRVSVKEQKSRWGSCSRQGNLNFNWRLLLAPLPVLDYVVIHELAHLKELNHSPRFWRLVASACPDYQEHKRWLRHNGAGLRF